MRLLLGRHPRIADGEPADLRSCVRIALDQHRGNAERTCDVIESVARIVARQQLLGVDVEREQVVDGVGVFGAVEPMQ
jgi:hypothetical protein